MAAWWQSMTTLEHVLLYIAVPATLLLLLQTVLLLAGGGADGGADGGESALEADASPEADLSADLGGDGADGGVCHLPHAGGADDHHPGEGASAGLHIFTVRGVITFLTLFGWGGLWLSQMGLRPFWAVFFAVEMGIVGMVAVAFLLRQATRLQYDGTLDIRNAVGLEGTVYLTVPAARSGSGKVSVTVQEQLREFEALTDNPGPIPTGASVRVTGVAEDDALLVEVYMDTAVSAEEREVNE